VGPPTKSDEAAMKTSIANATGVKEDQVVNFDISIVASSGRRRRLLSESDAGGFQERRRL